jgi:hypothetical protein
MMDLRRETLSSSGLGTFPSWPITPGAFLPLLEHSKLDPTYKVTEVIRFTLVTLNSALYLLKSPVTVSYVTIVPTTTVLLPNTLERLTKGFEFKPTMALMPA